MSNSSSASGGIGLTSAVFLVFLVLKLTGHINWSWAAVTAPLWVPLSLVAAFIVLALLIAGPVYLVQKARDRGLKHE